jgi:multiple sugar transport system permease protein
MLTINSRSARFVPYVFAAPAVLIMLAGLFYPIAQAFKLSVFEWSPGTDWDTAKFVGLDEFILALRDPAVWISMRVTILYVLISVFFEMLLGIALALLLERAVRGMRVFRTIFVLPMMIAPICVGLIWRYLLDAQFGPVNHVARFFGLPTIAWLADPSLAFVAMVVTDIWQWTPFVFIMVLAALQGLDASVTEAARIDGATWWQTVIRVKLPMIKQILIVTLLMRMIDGFRSLEVIYVMTFGGPGLSTELFSLHLYKAAFVSQKLGLASALSIMLLAVVTVLSLVILRMANPMKDSVR